MLMWAMTFAVKNRISTCDSSSNEEDCTRASDMPIATFLPSVQDLADLQERMLIVIQRILCENLVEFEPYLAHCTIHVPHQFAAESAEKSDVVSALPKYGIGNQPMSQHNTLFCFTPKRVCRS